MIGNHPPLQPFAVGQNQPLANGPYLGGRIFLLPSNVAAGGTVTFSHTLRAIPRQISVISPVVGEYPSRLAVTAGSNSSITVRFESPQSAGSALFLW